MDDNLDLSWLDDARNSSGLDISGAPNLSFLDGFGGEDYSSFLNTLPELTTPGAGYNFSNLLPDFNNIFGSDPELLNEFNYNVEVMDDGSRLITNELGKVVGGYDEEGREFGVNESGAGFYNDTGDLTAGESSINFGGNLADKADVDALFKYNKAISSGGYPVTNKDGSVTVKDKDGNDLFKVNNDGKVTDVPPLPRGPITPTTPKPTDKNTALLAALLGGLLGLAGAPKVGGARGYQGKAAGTSPMTATRTALPTTGAPGAGGKRFLSDVTYAAEGGLMGLGYQPNQNVAFMAAGGMPSAAEYLAGTRGLRLGDNRNYDRLVGSGYSIKDALDVLPKVADKEMARGGLSSLGSYSDGGRMLKGPGDGMSDSIPANIEGKRPARLANDEFVVPADVVSHLGNGSSDAGAKVLYDMMAKVRKARTGNSKQGKQINPKKYVPA
jgi:hypothetical protein